MFVMLCYVSSGACKLFCEVFSVRFWVNCFKRLANALQGSDTLQT